MEYGKNKNWLIFKGYVPQCDNSFQYTFEYCGTELYSTANLRESQINDLLEEMNKDFGYAPFDLKKAERLVGDGKEYYI